MKLWGGRFTKATDAAVDDFNSSIRVDKRMYKEDIAGSIAHARMLGARGIISRADCDIIIKTLEEILVDIESGAVCFKTDAEDIHMNIEKILTDRIGDAGKRLHTARSRNDQVALDIRMYLLNAAEHIKDMLVDTETALLKIAGENLETIMPGYTHLQKAQPVTLAHYMMAYACMFERDIDRLCDCAKRMRVMPLGSGALAGTTHPIDRESVAEELGFDSVTLNSIDGVSDRDFVLETEFCIALVMMHLSRFCEELILWNSDEFGYITMDDAFSTGSSIMPQKKNPDVAELIRGKSGRVYGNLMATLTVMKGLPLAYNKDMQEDKEAVFDSVDTLMMCLEVFPKMILTMKINRDRMLSGARGGFTNATDVADYLVKKGVPFRDAHEIVGKIVLYAEWNKKAIDELTLEQLKEQCPAIEEDIYSAISMQACVNGRSNIGGCAPEAVMSSIKRLKEKLRIS
ncbi:MAG: argininosuccinate lyase [Clostridia bacterium]|nr:argininosuccinate lyase [Clostridia bacterium]